MVSEGNSKLIPARRHGRMEVHWPKLPKEDIKRTRRKGISKWWRKIHLANVIYESFFTFSSYVLPQNILLSVNGVLFLVRH